jgi:hypothetical protein
VLGGEDLHDDRGRIVRLRTGSRFRILRSDTSIAFRP